MTASTVFFLLVVLACPLMMVWMMRGGHGHGGHTHSGRSHDHHGQRGEGGTQASTEDLRRRRAELDRLIEDRERQDAVERPPAGAPR